MSLQQPLRSGFSAHTTAREVIGARRLDGITAIVTGGYAGIGSFKTVEEGAATTIWCATSPQLDGLGGVYCENCDVALVRSGGDDGVRPYAIDPVIAQRLWTWSERWL